VACLGAVAYDPAVAVSKVTDALLAMTALDTSNLRVTFTAPSNGVVLVRLKGQAHGSASFPGVLLGVLDGATVRGRMAPMGQPASSLATVQCAQEAVYVVDGLTPGNSYTWDAAYGVEILVASTALKYGGPNNATTNDGFGEFNFEVWETPTLLAGKLYDPAVAVTKSMTALLAMTALDTTNLRHTITAPASGRVMWRIRGQYQGSLTMGQALFGVLDGATVRARTAPVRGLPLTGSATTNMALEASGVISGLTGGNSYTLDAAYGVEVVASAGGLKYGGPNDTTATNAFGGIAYELWAA
jgi:hypothetical protein